MTSLRQRNRHNAMRLTQRTALSLFEEHGFDNVTVGEVAAGVGMAASTLYRHFSTKEAIVLWDEHDIALDKAFARELSRLAPFAAVRAVFVTELGRRYNDDIEFQLRRVQYIHATEELHAAAVEADLRDTAELTTALEHYLSAENRGAAPLLAGAAMLALDTAFNRWQQAAAAEPLGELIAAAFDMLGNLEALR